jgi:NitT/TauT family transport system substrate-binding protein
MKKNFILTIIILLQTSILAACGAPAPANPLEPIHLKVGYQPFLTAAPFFIAQKEGYFTEQGLDVELVLFTSAGETLPAFISGEIDIFAEAVVAGSLNAVAQGEGFKYVAEKGYINPDANCVDQALIARTDLLNDGFLDDPENVKGLNFAFTRATVFEYAIDVQLQNLGLTQADVQTIDMPQQPARLEALKSGAVDVVTFPEPWITRARSSGAANIWVPFDQLVPFAPLSAIIYGPSVTGNTDAGNRFMVAFLKGVATYNEGMTDSNVATISEYTQLSLEDVKAACWPSMVGDGQIHAEAWGPYQDWLVSKGYLDQIINMDELWDPQYINFANEALK